MFNPVQTIQNSFEVRLNPSSSSYKILEADSQAFVLDCLPLYGNNAGVTFLLLSANYPKIFKYQLAWSALTELSVQCQFNNQLTTATKLTIWGEY